ncbi:MAG TPA: Hsp20/alpha crystallin family protein [Pyrinomonadaceae bacterium]|jgi:HSP20 family protein
MSIVKYDPFRDLRSLQDEVNRLFSMSFPRGGAAGGQDEVMRGAWTPSVDIYEGKDEIVLEAELPGMKPEDVDVSIENNIITIRGERRFEKKDESDNYHRVERSYGSFTRSFTLPRNVVGDQAKADFTNGVLHVSLPKREEEKARKIQISGASSNESRTIETNATETQKQANTANA